MGLEVIDISDKFFGEDDLVATDNDSLLYRYNKEQVFTIAKKLYIPHQVRQWNSHTRFSDGEEPPVVLEEVLPGALGVLGKMFDVYSAMPKGAYYLSRDNNLDDNRNATDFKEVVGETLWLGRKQYGGFVTRELDFRYFFGSEIANMHLPDLSLFVSLHINEELNHIKPGSKSAVWSYLEPIDEEGLRTLLCSKFDQWRQQNEEWFEARCQWEVDWRVEDGADPKDFDVNWFLKSRRIPTKLPILSSRSINRKLGYYPETTSVGSAEELVGFVNRFLTNTEPGQAFIE